MIGKQKMQFPPKKNNKTGSPKSSIIFFSNKNSWNKGKAKLLALLTYSNGSH